MQKLPELFEDRLPSGENLRAAKSMDTGAYRPSRVYSSMDREEIKKFVDESLKSGLISPSSSSWDSPLLLVSKKDGTKRICVDYRAVNAITHTKAFPISSIDAAFIMLRGKQHFTCLDLKSGYHQMRLDPASNKKHVQEVLQRLTRHGLILSPKKCVWGARKIHFLGHVVDGEGIRPYPSKVEAVRAFAAPGNITEVRNFINLDTYFKRYIPAFARMASPLYELTQNSPRRGAGITWKQRHQEAMDSLKSFPPPCPITAYFTPLCSAPTPLIARWVAASFRIQLPFLPLIQLSTTTASRSRRAGSDPIPSRAANCLRHSLVTAHKNVSFWQRFTV